MILNEHTSFGSLRVKHAVGSGSFATVYECVDSEDGQTYALKVILKVFIKESRLNTLRKEAEILSTISHPNVIKYYSLIQNDQLIGLKMQYIEGGTLSTQIAQRKANGTPFKDQERATIIRGLLQALNYLHRNGIIHRDIKPENVLFSNSSNLSSLKIIDFGLSAKIEFHLPKHMKMQCGTFLFMAPEVFSKPSYSKAVDVWSIAVIMYMLFTFEHPLYRRGMSTEEFKLTLHTCRFPPLPEPLANDLLERISKIDYEQRYNVPEALSHPWITRNFQDDIPLSIYDSFQGFGTAQLIGQTLQGLLVLKASISSQATFRQVDAAYEAKIHEIRSLAGSTRRLLPSRRTVRSQNQQLFKKMKQALQEITIKERRPVNYDEEQQSPTLNKHQQAFRELFTKPKTARQLLSQTKSVIDRHQSVREGVSLEEQSSSQRLMSELDFLSVTESPNRTPIGTPSHAGDTTRVRSACKKPSSLISASQRSRRSTPTVEATVVTSDIMSPNASARQGSNGFRSFLRQRSSYQPYATVSSTAKKKQSIHSTDSSKASSPPRKDYMREPYSLGQKGSPIQLISALGVSTSLPLRSVQSKQSNNLRSHWNYRK